MERNQSVWITGASAGIGEALAVKLLREGCRVALTARREGMLQEFRRGRSGAEQERTLLLPCDVTKQDDLAAQYEALKERWGVPDMIVANAGTHIHMEAKEIRFERCKKILDLNLYGAIGFIALVLPDFLEKGRGTIVGVASVAGYRGLPTAAAYGASKAGLINFLESLRLDVEPHGIQVVIVNPGFVLTPLTDKNTFRMPFLISAERAANYIYDGLRKGKMEIHFPPAFSWTLKALRILPYPLYHHLIRIRTRRGERVI
jgi:short-subunit dehydrogenase